MQPRFTTHASAAPLLTTTSSAVRPEGKESSTVLTKGGTEAGARFWKNASPAAPFTKRLSAIGRSITPRKAPGATAR